MRWAPPRQRSWHGQKPRSEPAERLRAETEVDRALRSETEKTNLRGQLERLRIEFEDLLLATIG